MTDISDTSLDVEAEEATSVAEIIEAHPVAEVLGRSPRIKLLLAFYTAAEPLSPDQVTDRAGLAVSTWYNHKDELLESGFIEQHDKIGNSPRYRLTKGDERVELFEQFAQVVAGSTA
jgi:hypothetical protein